MGPFPILFLDDDILGHPHLSPLTVWSDGHSLYWYHNKQSLVLSRESSWPRELEVPEQGLKLFFLFNSAFIVVKVTGILSGLSEMNLFPYFLFSSNLFEIFPASWCKQEANMKYFKILKQIWNKKAQEQLFVGLLASFGEKLKI